MRWRVMYIFTFINLHLSFLLRSPVLNQKKKLVNTETFCIVGTVCPVNGMENNYGGEKEGKGKVADFEKIDKLKKKKKNFVT